MRLATRSKFHNIKTVVGGITFDSKAEAARYRELLLLASHGSISGLACHPQFELQAAFKDNQGKKQSAIKFTADFSYTESGVSVVEDVKSRPTATAAFRIRERLFRRKFPEIDFRVVMA